MADELDMCEQDGTAPECAADRRAWPRRIAWVAVVLLAVAVLNKGVSFVFEHYGSTSELTWAQYRMAEPGSLDTVILGNSAALSDFDPYTLDEELGSSTFNLAFYALSNRYVYSALERAIDDQNSPAMTSSLRRPSASSGEGSRTGWPSRCAASAQTATHTRTGQRRSTMPDAGDVGRFGLTAGCRSPRRAPSRPPPRGWRHRARSGIRRAWCAAHRR